MTIAQARPGGQWLLEHLIRSGHVTESGVTRRARLRLCPRGCRSWVLVGLNDTMCAIEVRMDPRPLSALGEALALLEGRYTHALRREGGRYVLDPRLASDVVRRPAGVTPREDALRQHRCGDPPPVGALVADTAFVEAAPPPSDPPF